MATTQKSEKRRAIETAAFTGIVTAAILAVTSYTIVWIRLRDNFAGSWTHSDERFRLDSVARLLETYQKEHGAYPDKLIQVVKDSTEEDQLLDTWGHMYDYRVTAEGYELSSLGRDGQPGGESLDADFDAHTLNWRTVNPKAPPARISFFEFSEVNPRSGACVFYSVVVGIAVFFSSLPSSKGIPPRSQVFVSAVFTTIFSLIVAGFMSVAHIPSGH